MNNRKNALTSFFYQITTIIQGLVLPKLILSAFGSEVNGLVSSITQFLSFISLLEGGLGAVVLAELYKPIEERDDRKVQSILKVCQTFFTRLTAVFFLYSLFIAFIYPRFVVTDFTANHISTLVLIISLTTVSQYMFSITYRLLLQAEQKLYVVNCISGVTVLINTASAALIIIIYPSIHILKLCSGIIYLIQPLVYRLFIEKKYSIDSIMHSSDRVVLKNRWSGFSQNLAHFVNMNTDVALITLFMPLEYASIYSVHLLVINALRGLVSNVGNSYQSALGKYIAIGDIEQLKQKFVKFEEALWLSGMILFFCCILLINPFIQIYTSGIVDAVYYQPVFSFVLVLANMLYVIRDPYRLLVLAGGKFKETNFGSIAEAVLNIGLSLLLISEFGLAGVAIGTLAAIAYRLCYLIWYLKRDILYKSYTSLLPYLITFFFAFFANLAVYILYPLKLMSIPRFVLAGALVLIAESAFCLLIYWIVRTVFGSFVSRSGNKKQAMEKESKCSQ